jgi:hypothetical protein
MRRVRPSPSRFSVVTGSLVLVLVVALAVPYARTQTLPTRVVKISRGGGTFSIGGSEGSLTAGGTIVSGGGTVGASRRGNSATAGNDIGISATEIQLGISILDAGAAQQFGASFDTGNQVGRWNGLIAKVNASGGIAGRKLVPHYRTIELINHPVETARAACVGWTTDDKVFSVLYTAQMTEATAVCATGEHLTPLVTSQGLDEGYYGNGLLFTTGPSSQRLLLDQVHFLERTGALKGKTLGVLSGDGGILATVNATLLPELRKLGHDAHVEVISNDTSASQRLPVAVSNFKAAGVDFVIMAATSILVAPFAQAADRADYHPRIHASDFYYQVNDAVSQFFPDSFDGQTALSIQAFPNNNTPGATEWPADHDCIERVKSSDAKTSDKHALAYNLGTIECGVFDMWVAMARKAGPTLSRATLIDGAERAGPLALASTLNGSLGPGKHDFDDGVREVVWRLACRCWQMTDGPNAQPRPLS